MNAWPVQGPGPDPATAQQLIYAVGLKPRLAAWLLDMLLIAGLSILPVGIIVAIGGLAWNPEAMRQVDANALALPTVPWLVVDTGPLIVGATLWVALAIVYGAVCWSVLRGLPGQRLRGLQVADARTGRNLSPVRATLRAVLINGIPAAGTALAVVGMAELMSIVPANNTNDMTLLQSGEGQRWSSYVFAGGLVAVIWPAILAISTAGSPGWRGLHDRLSGSVVVRVARPRAAWRSTYYGWAPPGSGALPPPAGSAPGQVGAPPGPAGVPPGPAWPPPGFGPNSGSPPGWTGLPPAEPGSPSHESWPGLLPPDELPASLRPGQEEGEKEHGEGFGAAAFGRRMGAYGIDLIVIFAVYSTLKLLIAPPDSSGQAAPERLWMLAGLAGGVAQAVYFVASWWLVGGSPGQKALGLRLGRDTTGKRIGPADALVRWSALQGPVALWMAAPLAASSLLMVIAAGWAVVLIRSVRTDPEGRGYHDRLAGSMVLEDR